MEIARIFSIDDALVYLTARDQQRGEAAVRQPQAEGLSPYFHLLDVTDEASVAALADTLRQRHGGVDIFISNAAARISPNIPPVQQVSQFINTNNHGTHRLIKAFMPLLKEGARFLIVASAFGSLRHLPNQLHHKFDVTQASLEEIDTVMAEYGQLVEADQAVQAGWPEWINLPSKIGQVAAMKVMARLMQAEAKQRDILINAVCPGLVDTEASRPWFSDMSAAQSPDQAAVDVVWLATLPPRTAAPYGELVQHREVIPFR